MMPNRSSKKRPRDLNLLAASIVEEATSGKPEPAPVEESAEDVSAHAAALGRLGGKKGGPARARALTPEQRREIARKAAQSRWAKPTEP